MPKRGGFNNCNILVDDNNIDYGEPVFYGLMAAHIAIRKQSKSTLSSSNSKKRKKLRIEMRSECHENYFVLHFEMHVYEVHRKHTA